MPFRRALVWSEMQTISYRTWTPEADSTLVDDNPYAKSAYKCLMFEWLLFSTE